MVPKCLNGIRKIGNGAMPQAHSDKVKCSNLGKTSMKLLFATLLLFFLLLSSSFLERAMGQADSSYCSKKCGDRCAKAGVLDRCLKVLWSMLPGVPVCSFWDLWEQA
ncbi:Snakin-1 [Quillaja saponaria]|uniref:Snakin-1 n=1 Tax=Quillaja saponaria TaxID=32244 RepID=A0AAD7KUN1_QUISA|nr:Snakin-1 [Quillaja saponaria]